LAGGIAHDFNNLLMGVLGNADLANRKLPSDSPARENLAEIEKAAQRAADLARQMLAYSGKGRFVIGKIEINAVVEEMVHLLESSISKSALLRYDFAANLPVVEADATQIRQVIMNLITNASEAIGEGDGEILISTGRMDCDRAYLRATYLDEQQPAGSYVFLEVSDTGCGMDKATVEKLFEPFFTTKFTGRGLGLAATLGIIRSHHGAIKVDSTPGKGTTIRVLLPALEGQVAQDGDVASDTDDWQGQGTILLVDDEETVLTTSERMLEFLGFMVLTARDGTEAINLFRARADDIDCVILDLTMPSLSGDQVFDELRRIKNDARVVLSSGYSEQEIKERFAGKGLAGFIQKPYQLASLKTKLKQVLAP
jgi:two-component system cell cycle sensor histidine kinase/response regulator CckA